MDKEADLGCLDLDAPFFYLLEVFLQVLAERDAIDTDLRVGHHDELIEVAMSTVALLHQVDCFQN